MAFTERPPAVGDPLTLLKINLIERTHPGAKTVIADIYMPAVGGPPKIPGSRRIQRIIGKSQVLSPIK
jgi:hypothetical protein